MDARKASTAEIMSVAKVAGQKCPFNEEQVKHLREVFIMFDADKSDTISRSELEQMIRALGFITITPGAVGRLFDEADTDRSGTISFEEFLVVTAKAGGERTKSFTDRELRSAFSLYDLDRDGFITAHELKTVMLSTGEDLSDKDAQVMIDMADIDGDGRVSLEEFKRFMSD